MLLDYSFSHLFCFGILARMKLHYITLVIVLLLGLLTVGMQCRNVDESRRNYRREERKLRRLERSRRAHLHARDKGHHPKGQAAGVATAAPAEVLTPATPPVILRQDKVQDMQDLINSELQSIHSQRNNNNNTAHVQNSNASLSGSVNVEGFNASFGNWSSDNTTMNETLRGTTERPTKSTPSPQQIHRWRINQR